MPCRDQQRGEGHHANGERIQVAPAATWVMQGGGEENQPEERHADALEDAQRAWLEAESELRVKRVGDERGAQRKADEIDQAAYGYALRRRRCRQCGGGSGGCGRNGRGIGAAPQLALDVIYMVHGKDIRHTSLDDVERELRGGSDTSAAPPAPG